MKIITIQEALRRKLDRQKAIPELELSASGHCAHIGKLSPGCLHCFVPDTYARNINVGSRCNANCSYCTSDTQVAELSRDYVRNVKMALFRNSLAPDFHPTSLSFSGGGEPLLYVDVIAEYLRLHRELTEKADKRPWYHVYTNGLMADLDTVLRLKDIGLDEMRFHIGASGFSRKVYDNMAGAARHLRAVTVETPSWPPHRAKLFEMLPIIADIGVKHLNVGEIEVRATNRDEIDRLLPDAEVYQASETFLDDGGLVYDLMAQALGKGYGYSVLDCNSFVKMIQRTPAKWVCHEDPGDLCRAYS